MVILSIGDVVTDNISDMMLPFDMLVNYFQT